MAGKIAAEIDDKHTRFRFGHLHRRPGIADADRRHRPARDQRAGRTVDLDRRFPRCIIEIWLAPALDFTPRIMDFAEINAVVQYWPCLLYTSDAADE